jgi:hypothetical protein
VRVLRWRVFLHGSIREVEEGRYHRLEPPRKGDAMTALRSAQVVEALRGWVKDAHTHYSIKDELYRANLLSILDSYSSLRAALEKPRNVTMGLVHDRLREVGIVVDREKT